MITFYNLTFMSLLLICFIGINFCESEAAELVILEVPKEIKIGVGESSKIDLQVFVKDGYHVQANPTSNEFLIPTTIDNISVNDIEVGKPEYPPGKPFTLESESSPISVYDGKFNIGLPIQMPQNIKLSKAELKGRFRYQACDYKRCYFPQSILFKIPIKIKK